MDISEISISNMSIPIIHSYKMDISEMGISEIDKISDTSGYYIFPIYPFPIYPFYRYGYIGMDILEIMKSEVLEFRYVRFRYVHFLSYHPFYLTP
jgi:hypothetical protein